MKMLERLELVNFRSFLNKQIDLHQVNVVIGNNGVGKSNLVEAIYLLGTGSSFRADRDIEMVNYDSQYCAVLGNGADVDLKIEFILGRKKYLVNGIPRRMSDFVGKVKCVLFSPLDMELVSGTPGFRRRYLDFVISQFDSEYHRCLVSYEKGLRQRNKLLDLIREGRANRSQMFFWDRLVIKNGNYITESREAYLNEARGEKYSLIYDKSVISEMRLKQYEREEVLVGSTLVGPHRDDFSIEFDKDGRGSRKSLAKYASRGEQRMGVFWLKLYEKQKLGDSPLLLLDDLMSELDSEHRLEVVGMLEEHMRIGGQVVMTSADQNQLKSDSSWHQIRLSE